jgi:hypothetical protein
MTRRPARLILLLVLVWLAATQIAEIRLLQNGLSRTADPFSEADAMRSSEYYVTHGFASNAGLPNVTYGARFPGAGSVLDPLTGLYHGVYTHYPPLPNLLCGLFEITIGYAHVWAWRLVPVALALLATAFLFFSLERAFGGAVAGTASVLFAFTPMTVTYMHGLHFQGYAHALMLAELALLTTVAFEQERASAAQLAALAAIGFVQGWLSFEYVFVVTGAAVPVMLVARQRGRTVRASLVLSLVVAAGAGFAAANVLHLLQVARFHGTLAAAIRDFTNAGAQRIAGNGRASYPVHVLRVVGFYVKMLAIGPNNRDFGGLLPAVTAGLLLVAGTWRAADVTGMFAAYGLAFLWVVAMPNHAEDHTHFVPRIFFLAYYTAALACALRAGDWVTLRARSGTSPARGSTSADRE